MSRQTEWLFEVPMAAETTQYANPYTSPEYFSHPEWESEWELPEAFPLNEEEWETAGRRKVPSRPVPQHPARVQGSRAAMQRPPVRQIPRGGRAIPTPRRAMPPRGLKRPIPMPKRPGIQSKPSLPVGQPTHRTVYGWGQYRRKVEELPPNQQAVLKSIGDQIIASQKSGRPVKTVDVCGHADWDTPRNPQREQQMSEERAQMVTQWLMKYIGDTLTNQILWFQRGMGATQLKASPTTEANRQKNRRVEVYLDAKSPGVCPASPPPPPPPGSKKGTLLVRVVGKKEGSSERTPLQTIVFLHRSGSSRQEAALETDSNGYADFGQRNPGSYTITASAPANSNYMSKSVQVLIESGKKHQVQIELTTRAGSWIDKIDWDEKFSRNYGELCSAINMQRSECGIASTLPFPLDNLSCQIVRKLNPKSPCCMTSSEIEAWLDAEVCVRVHNEIVAETLMNPGPVVQAKYADWKQRVRKGKPCVG
jgi:hypothetical protein